MTSGVAGTDARSSTIRYGAWFVNRYTERTHAAGGQIVSTGTTTDPVILGPSGSLEPHILRQGSISPDPPGVALALADLYLDTALESL